jgi:hypothetical protein
MANTKTTKKVKGSRPTGLPNRLSEFIRLGLHDLKLVERSRRYRVDMSSWHELGHGLENEKICFVCLAGAIMAKTLHTPIDQSLYLGNMDTVFGKRNTIKFQALDFLRCGNVGLAAELMGFSKRRRDRLRAYQRVITRYSEDPKGFRRDLLQLARELESIGE